VVIRLFTRYRDLRCPKSLQHGPDEFRFQQWHITRGGIRHLGLRCECLQSRRQPGQRAESFLGIPDDLVKENLIFDPSVKVGSLMTS